MLIFSWVLAIVLIVAYGAALVGIIVHELGIDLFGCRRRRQSWKGDTPGSAGGS